MLSIPAFVGILFFNGITLGDAFSCPGQWGMYADPTDCGFFYQCNHGTGYRSACPGGLMFNAAGGYCDWPANVNCDAEGPASTTTTTTTTTATTTQVARGSGEFSCPDQWGMYPDPEDCASYYQCNHGVEYRKRCPGGLMFHSGGYCDWPANVDCNSAPPAPTSAPSTTTTVPPSTTPSPATTTTTAKPTAAPSTPKPTDPSTTTAFVPSQPSCETKTSEPITEEIRKMRPKTCMADNQVVEAVSPGSNSNPDNVKVVESILPPATFRSLFPSANPAYTYDNFLKAFAKFPSLCQTENVCRRTLAVMFAHFQQETAGLVYLEEINKSDYCATWSSWVVAAYPCTPGAHYYGRGAKQLSWNYNYGAFSNAMYGDAQVLLDNPDLVASTWLNFASALWFFVTPQPPKPSMLSVLDGSWQPNQHDASGNKVPGFGATTMIINGGLECGSGPSNPNGSNNRQQYYKQFASTFNVDISGEKLDCRDMTKFDGQGSFNPSIYWQPSSGCQLGIWQTAYNSLVEGDYAKCQANM